MPVPPFAKNHLAMQRGGARGVGQVSKARLAEWLGRAGLDPNDPRNAWCALISRPYQLTARE